MSLPDFYSSPIHLPFNRTSLDGQFKLEAPDSDPGVLFGDYHIEADSPAVNAGIDLTGLYPELQLDFDMDPRVAPVDIGADELP